MSIKVSNVHFQVIGQCANPPVLRNTPVSMLSKADYGCGSELDMKSDSYTILIAVTVGVCVLFLVVGIILVIYCWKKRPCNFSIMFHRRQTPKKRLSKNFNGDKRDIVVLQENLVDDDRRFLTLSGKNFCDPEYANIDLNSNRSEHLYSSIAEVTETVPKYTIPIANIQCPDVKTTPI